MYGNEPWTRYWEIVGAISLTNSIGPRRLGVKTAFGNLVGRPLPMN